MKKLLLFGLIIFQTISSYSQINTDKISFELRYPIPLGDNLLNKGFGDGYLGLIDIGVDYNVIETNRIGIGVLFNSSILRLSETDVTLFILSPKIKIDYEININKFSIIPQIGLGYSNWRFRAPAIMMTDEFGNPVEGEKYKENENGLTIKGGTKFVFNSSKNLNWYFQIAYEFTKLEKPDYGANDSKYNRNMHLLYPGIGLIWNFNKE